MPCGRGASLWRAAAWSGCVRRASLRTSGPLRLRCSASTLDALKLWIRRGWRLVARRSGQCRRDIVAHPP